MTHKSIVLTLCTFVFAISPAFSKIMAASSTLPPKSKSAFDVLGWTKQLKALNADMLQPYSLAKKLKTASFLQAAIILNKKTQETLQLKIKAVEKLIAAVKITLESSQKILAVIQALEPKNKAETALLGELLAKQKRTHAAFKKRLAGLEKEKSSLTQKIKTLEQENAKKSNQRKNSLDDADKIKSTINLKSL